MKYLLVLAAYFMLSLAQAQRVGIYTFEKNFNEQSGKFPSLKVLNREGKFEQDLLPELGNMSRSVYAFEKNCGLQFDNKMASDFFNGSYTIEIYFKFDALDSWKRVVDFKNRKSDNGCYIYDGKLNFYNYAIGERAPVNPKEYTHYVVSRNVKTKQMKMYVDGQSKIEFTDKLDEGVVDAEGMVNFFFDDLIVKDESSAGTVALIKIYDYIVDPATVKKGFVALEADMKKLVVEIPKIEEAAKLKKVEIIEPDEAFTFVAHVQNELNKQSVNNAAIIVLDSNMVESQRFNLVNNKIELPILPKKEYNLVVEAIGFLPVGLHLSSEELKKRKRYDNVFAMQPISVGLTVKLDNLRFQQSTSILLPESNLELEKIVIFLRDNPTVEVEIQGHTDNQGDFDLNLELSRQRAEAVKSQLIKQKINGNRIFCKGFGGTRPLVNNNREESRHLNRRVELIIKKY